MPDITLPGRPTRSGIVGLQYVQGPHPERPLDFQQPYGRVNTRVPEAIDLAHAMGGIADPIRQSIQLGRFQRRPARMQLALTGFTPEVASGWRDSFAPFGSKFQGWPQISSTSIGAGDQGMLPWTEKTNVRKPRSMTMSRLMDILTGNN